MISQFSYCDSSSSGPFSTSSSIASTTIFFITINQNTMLFWICLCGITKCVCWVSTNYLANCPTRVLRIFMEALVFLWLAINSCINWLSKYFNFFCFILLWSCLCIMLKRLSIGYTNFKSPSLIEVVVSLKIVVQMFAMPFLFPK